MSEFSEMPGVPAGLSAEFEALRAEDRAFYSAVAQRVNKTTSKLAKKVFKPSEHVPKDFGANIREPEDERSGPEY